MIQSPGGCNAYTSTLVKQSHDCGASCMYIFPGVSILPFSASLQTGMLKMLSPSARPVIISIEERTKIFIENMGSHLSLPPRRLRLDERSI